MQRVKRNLSGLLSEEEIDVLGKLQSELTDLEMKFAFLTKIFLMVLFLMDGIILIDKPRGKSSHQAVQIIKKKLGARRVGHAGTLDPLATGLLIILINKATKLSDFFLNKDKVYEVEAQLFTETDTGDVMGNVTKQEKNKNIKLDQINQALSSFSNSEYWQKPPLYSAVKLKGRKLYQYARKGLAVEISARLVRVDYLKLLKYIPQQGTVKLLVNCSKGTYIRSLVKDIAQKLGTVATVKQLRRISSGEFHVQQAIFLEEVDQKKIIPLAEINSSFLTEPDPKKSRN